MYNDESRLIPNNSINSDIVKTADGKLIDRVVWRFYLIPRWMYSEYFHIYCFRWGLQIVRQYLVCHKDELAKNACKVKGVSWQTWGTID